MQSSQRARPLSRRRELLGVLWEEEVQGSQVWERVWERERGRGWVRH